MKKWKATSLFAVFLAGMILSGFPMEIHAAASRLSVSSATISNGDTLDINVKGEAETKGTYLSSDSRIAKISKKGVVTAKKTGNATITWKKGKKKLSCKIKVVKAPTLSRTKITVAKGKKEKVSVKKQGNKSLKVTWTSGNKKVAVVRGGTITGISKGSTTVTAKIKGNKKTWKKKVLVTVGKTGDSGKAKPVVYMTSDISPEGMVRVYEALKWEPSGNVAVKLSTGEPPASNYLEPSLIGDLVKQVDGTIVECNTAYGGSRAETAMHLQVAKDHGFTEIADVDIQDAKGSMALTVKGGKHLKKNYVGKNFKNYDSYLVLSHFKGHAMAGFGGAIKNISIGMGSSEGKCWIHSAGESKDDPWGGEQDDFLESMGEAGKSVSDYLGNGKRIVYINGINC